MSEHPRASPRPPDDSAPLLLEKTPSHFPVTAQYVKNKMAEAGMRPAHVPQRREPLWVAIFVGIVTASGPLLMLENPRWNVVLAAALMGAGSSLGTYFGIRSAGVQKR
jgi:hypothetical protein